MSVALLDWLSLLIRWLHFGAGVAWIGASFYFIWVENALERGRQRNEAVAGHLWAVHGGGFYYLEKYKAGPANLPSELHWFKWEAYTTWLSGLLLMVVVYYANAQAWLLLPDSSLAPWQGIILSLAILAASLGIYLGLCSTSLLNRPAVLGIIGLLISLVGVLLMREFFTPRAAMIHLGASVGTIMVANVLMVIIPGQRLLVSIVETGAKPDPALVKRGALRSTHNNYLTFPVLLMMVSSHYPLLYSTEHWMVALAGLIVGSVCLRHFLNLRNRKTYRWGWAGGAIGVVLLAIIVSLPWGSGSSDGEEIDYARVRTLINIHCVGCHADNPTDSLFKEAPLGFVLDSDALIQANAASIYQRTVIDRSMPFNNQTNMTDDERRLIAQWALSVEQEGSQ